MNPNALILRPDPATKAEDEEAITTMTQPRSAAVLSPSPKPTGRGSIGRLPRCSVSRLSVDSSDARAASSVVRQMFPAYVADALLRVRAHQWSTSYLFLKLGIEHVILIFETWNLIKVWKE